MRTKCDWSRPARLSLAFLLGVGLVVAVTCSLPVFAQDPTSAPTDNGSLAAPMPNVLLGSGFWASPASIGDNLTGTSPTQTGRNFRDGTASDCDATPKTYPGLNDSAVRFINTYQFTNDTINKQCVVVTLADLTGGINFFAQTYLGSFNSANLATNYLADGGSSPLGRAPQSYSFNVNPGQTYIIVVNQVLAGAIATPIPYALTVRNRTAGGGEVTLLSSPVRIYDTRPGATAPIGAGTGPLAAGSTTTIQVTGTLVGGIGVPARARAVVGNVSAVTTTGGGNLRLFPAGVATPTVASISYAAGQTTTNGVTVGLSATGQMSIFVGGSGTTHVTFDVTGYIMSPIG
jgi:hypothetical protein